MGLEDIDRVDVDVHDLNNSNKALSNASISAVSTPSDDDFAKGYVDPKEERAFVWKLDLWFLTIGFLGYMFKYIDQTNISNAYVSGMKEDLKLYGNELNYFTTFFKSVSAGLLNARHADSVHKPERPNPLAKFYLKPRDIEIALARARRVGRKPQIGITPKDFLRCFTFWQLWAFAIAWPIGSNFTPASYFNLWLKSLTNANGTKKYTVAMLNYLPIIGQAVQLVAELLFSGFSDYFQTRLPFLLLHSVINIVSLVILIVRPTNEHAYMAGWYMNYIGAVSTMLLASWASTHLQHEPQVRTVLFASGTILAYLMSAFLPIAAYPAKEAPHWRIGAKLYLGFACAAVVLFVGIWWAFRREEKKEQEQSIKGDTAGEPARKDEDASAPNLRGVILPSGL
ncbi:hypothetical protein SLS59_008395 [Nothophoma quercina]|uniref:Major facilitator superfamily transporter n=1 Tax=Nothophoma quercina TaxID=749835 RepID=A0ABR3QTH7_9PLEO